MKKLITLLSLSLVVLTTKATDTPGRIRFSPAVGKTISPSGVGSLCNIGVTSTYRSLTVFTFSNIQRKNMHFSGGQLGMYVKPGIRNKKMALIFNYSLIANKDAHITSTSELILRGVETAPFSTKRASTLEQYLGFGILVPSKMNTIIETSIGFGHYFYSIPNTISYNSVGLMLKSTISFGTI